MNETLASPASIAVARNNVTAYGWKALAGSVSGYCMDGFDMLILGFMLAAISADLTLTKTQAVSLVTWILVGAVAGGSGVRCESWDRQVAPHDLRRTCARLCHAAGGELEQVQLLLGHFSIQTTERYLGCKQRIRDAVNDKIGLEPPD
jgi:hypothetical protein